MMVMLMFLIMVVMAMLMFFDYGDDGRVYVPDCGGDGRV